MESREEEKMGEGDKDRSEKKVKGKKVNEKIIEGSETRKVEAVIEKTEKYEQIQRRKKGAKIEKGR